MIARPAPISERPRGSRVAGKTIVVTGGATGIGRAVAELLGKEGATIVVADRNTEAGAQAAQTIVADGGVARFVETDVSREEECVRLIRETVDAYGRIDGLANVAGIYPRASLTDTTLDLWRTIMAVNLEGPFVLCREAAPQMVKAGGGSIVNIGSMTGFGGGANLTAYSVSKGALLTLTRNVAAAYIRKGVRVNYLNPGWVITDTEIRVQAAQGYDEAWLRERGEALPGGRHSTPEDVALTILFLMSDESAMVNGQVISVDAGMAALPSLRSVSGRRE
ncbi:MAG: SDR family oxidoreductase [Chloroflexi bacterium]|nr:SDR family oxidoreductase [Chloroflexota bacterium]